MDANKNIPPDLKYIENIARLLDSKYKIPGTNFRFGLDPIFGLIPGLGDAGTFVISTVLIFYMAKFGASGKLVILMMLNVLLDTVFGSIPIIGWIFDFYYKANDRNINMLKKHYREGKYQGSGKGIILLLLVFLLAIMILVFYLFYKLIAWVIGLF